MRRPNMSCPFSSRLGAVTAAATALLLLLLAAPAGAQQAVLGPCASTSESSVAAWYASAQLLPGNYEAISCATLDDQPGLELVIIERDEDGDPVGWKVLRSDPDRVRVAFARSPGGFRGLTVEAIRVTEEDRQRNGDTRYSEFVHDPDVGYRLDERRWRGRKIGSRRIRIRAEDAARLGRFDLQDATLGRAMRRFGHPLRYLTRGRSACDVRFRRGVTVEAVTFGGPRPRRCSSRLAVLRVRMQARGWHTEEDVRVGDSRTYLERAYPDAAPLVDFDGTVDPDRIVLQDAFFGFGVTGRSNTLVAVLREDRIVRFEALWPNAGE